MMQFVLEILVVALALIGFVTNFFPCTSTNAGSLLVDAMYAILALLVLKSVSKDRVREYIVPLFLFGLFLLWCLGLVALGPGAFGQKVMGFRNNILYPGIWILIALSNVRLRAKRVIDIIWWSGLVVCSFAIFQYFFVDALPDSLLVLRGDGRLVLLNGDVFRVTGLVGHTIVFSGYSALILLVGWMRPEREQSIWVKVLEIIPAWALYLTYTRTANVAILLVWGFAWSFLRMKRLWCGICRYLFVIFIIIFLTQSGRDNSFFANVFQRPFTVQKSSTAQKPLIVQRMSSADSASQGSTPMHIELFKKGLVLLKAHPVVGTGIGSQGYSSHEPPEINVLKDGYWFATALETGIPGFLLWAIFLVWTARRRSFISVSLPFWR